MAAEYDDAWILSKKKQIKESFRLFDKDQKNTVPQDEVPTIMRYLGLYPGDKELSKEIIPEMQEDEPTTFVVYDKFEAVVLKLMQERTCEPNSEETLLQCFRFLDQKGNGYIEASTMRDLMANKGVPFREKEIDDFMKDAKDKETGHIYYEDYITLLMSFNAK